MSFKQIVGALEALSLLNVGYSGKNRQVQLFKAGGLDGKQDCCAFNGPIPTWNMLHYLLRCLFRLFRRRFNDIRIDLIELKL